MKKLLTVLLLIAGFLAADRGTGYILNRGLKRYFGLKQHANILLIGHSHLMLAIDKTTLEMETGYKVSKYCREGVNVADRYEMVKQFLESPYSDSLKTIIYGVDQFMFNGQGLSQNSYTLFYPFIDERNMDRYINSEASPSDYWLHKLICTTRYSDALLNSSIRGWMGNWQNMKNGTLDTTLLKRNIIARNERTINIDDKLKKTFEKTIKMIERRHIRIILLFTPIAQMLNEYEPVKRKQITDYLQELADQSSLIEYIDLNPMFATNYEIFFDPIHVNPKGQKAITEAVITYLKGEPTN